MKSNKSVMRTVRLKYKRCTSDLNVVWRLYKVSAGDGTIGYKARSIAILSRVNKQMEVEHTKVTGHMPSYTMTLRCA